MEVEGGVSAEGAIGGLGILVLVGEDDFEEVVDDFGFLLFFLLHQAFTEDLSSFAQCFERLLGFSFL